MATQTVTAPPDQPQTSVPLDPKKPRWEPRKLSAAMLNFWVDVALALAVTFVTWVSVMLQVVFPPPTLASGWLLWGFSYDQWRDAQFYGLCAAALLSLEHVVLHWKWVCSIVATKILRLTSRPDEGTQAMYGIATFVAIVIVLKAAIITALLTVQRPP